MVKMCGPTWIGVTGEKRARAQALRTHVLDVISHAHVRARTHLRNSSLDFYQNNLPSSLDLSFVKLFMNFFLNNHNNVNFL